MAARDRRMHIGASALASEESTPALKAAPSRGRSHATTLSAFAADCGLEFHEDRESMSSRHQSARLTGG
jgi:hypothetical protein